MKDDTPHSLTDERLLALFGDLSTKELGLLKEELARNDFDSLTDAKVHEALEKLVADGRGEVPPLPADVRTSFETARLRVLNETELPEVYETPKRYDSPSGQRTSEMSRWHSSVVITGGLAAAAAIVIAFVTYVRPVERPSSLSYADVVTLLTPGEETGFLEPIFTWNAENGGVVDVAVISAEGKEVASLVNAFSPLRWSSLKSTEALVSGELYMVEISTPTGLVANRQFATGAEAGGAPVPERSLEEIILQCQDLIAASRPADAWMLWGELTAIQKADPRMQALKEEILSVITG
ncbi:MAG: hypothetical protein P1U58_20065 [Verrucomicrobiales bacterium]|nr:hypothetical protein [Verrucomicrobiales bacterium]